jgi:hypothetical protein
MNNKALDENIFVPTLEKFLIQIKQEIYKVGSQANSIDSLENLDRYIMELNTYYYRSFHERFMPDYKQDITSQIKLLTGLKLEENLLSHHIALTIKRYAALHNQVKSLTSRLIELKLRLKEKKSSLVYGLQRQRLELWYNFKQFQDTTTDLTVYIGFLNDLSKELDKYSSRLDDSDLCLDWIFLVREHNPQDPGISSLFYEVQKNQRLLYNIIQQGVASGGLQAAIAEISRIINLMNKNIGDINTFQFYKSQFLMTCGHYMELIDLNLQLDNQEQLNTAISDFKKFLNKWINSIEFILPLLSKPFWQYLPELYKLHQSNPAYIQELYKDIYSIQENIDSIVQEINPTLDFDNHYLESSIQNILEFSAPLIKTISNENAIMNISPLARHILQLNQVTYYMISQNRFFTEQASHLGKLNEDIESLLSYLESKIALLNNIASDILRFLSPRNISRTWKNFEIRVEQIPLYKGRRLAAEYEYLLDKYSITTKVCDQDDLTILDEEGDIFIIRVDDEIIEEIPYMVIAKKG